MGIAAHINSASRFDGPRANPNLTPEQRKSYDNGVFLCPTCAVLVDKIPYHFPENLLKAWQAESEEWSRADFLKFKPHVNHSQASEGIRCFLDFFKTLFFHNGPSIETSEFLKNPSRIMLLNQLRPTSPFSSQYVQCVAMQKDMIRALQVIQLEMSDRGLWHHGDSFIQIYRQQYQDLTGEQKASIEKVELAIKDYCTLYNRLHEIMIGLYAPEI